MEKEAQKTGWLSNPFYSPFPSFSPENAAPSFNNLPVSDQGIEWAFSRLKLSDSFQPDAAAAHPASFSRMAESFPWWVTSGEIQKPLFSPQLQSGSSNNNNNWAIGSGGAQGNGELLGFWGRSSYLDEEDHYPISVVECDQGPGCFGANFDNYGSSLLHGRKLLSVTANGSYPVPSLPLQQSNFFFSSDYGTQKVNHFDFETLRGKLVPLVKNQEWGITLCWMLGNGVSEDEIEVVLPEIMDNLGDLMENQFGSRFVRMLFQRCSRDQKTRVVIALTRFRSKFLSICLNQYGVKAVQKILEMLDTPLQVSVVVVALIADAFVLATDTNGQHVLHYCVKNFHGRHTTDLIAKLALHCFEIATSQSGCCVLQSCMQNRDKIARELLIREILANARPLAEDPYGNYVVQRVIELKIPDATADLVKVFKGSFTMLSCNKYASNVVETFLRESGDREEIITELLLNPDGSSLLTDPFGNYVIQTALQVSKNEDHLCNALVRIIEQNASSMHSNLFGKKILASVERMKQARAS